MKNLENKSIRPIFRGKMMKAHHTLASYLPNSQDTTCPPNIHVAVSSHAPANANTEDMSEEERVIGLDRLRDMGFSQQEVEEFRALFNSAHRGGGGDLREMEERWIEESEITPETMERVREEERERRELEGTYTDLFWGLVIGFSLGFIPLFWVFFFFL